MSVCTFKTFEEMETGNVRLPKSLQQDTHNNLESKIKITTKLIEECLEVSNNPVVLCSFGKDSLVMLHLILQVKKIPVIYWREPYFQSKFTHPQKIAEKWNLDVYDYPPSYTSYLQLDNYFDVYNFYYINKTTHMNLFTGTRNYTNKDKRFLCAVDDLVNRPKVPSYEFKWDCIFHGHKQVDPLYISESKKLQNVYLFGNGILALLLREWTHENVWEYIDKYNLPYNKKRYDKRIEKSNNDVFPTCHDCLDYRNVGKDIYCPKVKQNVEFIGRSKEDSLKFRDDLMGKVYK